MTLVKTTSLTELNRKIDAFFLEWGKGPSFIIVTAYSYGDLAYEVGLSEGVDEADAFAYQLKSINGIPVAISQASMKEEIQVV